MRVPAPLFGLLTERLFASLGRVHWQPTLEPVPFDSTRPSSAELRPASDPGGFDSRLPTRRRTALSGGAWVDHVPGWVTASAELFDRLARVAPWRALNRPMYARVVAVPRLVTGAWDDPPDPLPAMARTLGAAYGTALDAVSANLYRDGNDSVAWHGDRVGPRCSHSVVAILTLGCGRRFLLRPVSGGASIAFDPAPGDLLVLGGTCQRTWQHCVPKRARAGPRISVMFRQCHDPIP